MSWSISVSGKRDEVLAAADKAFEGITYLQGEENDLKNQAAALVKAAITAQDAATEVRVSANGHATISGERKMQTLRIEVIPSN